MQNKPKIVLLDMASVHFTEKIDNLIDKTSEKLFAYVPAVLTS